MLLTLTVFCALWEVCKGSTCEPKKKIFTAIIGPRLPGIHSLHQRIFYYVQSFAKTAIQGYENVDEMKIWPPIYTHDCFVNETIHSKGRGSNLVHREIWDYFYRHRRPCGLEHDDAIIIFEYDAFYGPKSAASVIIDAVIHMNTDLLYLGYCYQSRHHPRSTGLAPYCLHAYVLTLQGAKKLVELLDVCGLFADVQLSVFANKGLISWSYLNTSYDANYVDHLFNSQGIQMSGFLQYDGVVVQAKFDDNIPPLPDGT